MEKMKAVVEEGNCRKGYPQIANFESICGGCCEGTVFTFTSAASNGKLRQRLRYRATLVNPPKQKEEMNDSVFSEMRMMPPYRESLSGNLDAQNYAHGLIPTKFRDPNNGNGSGFLYPTSQGQPSKLMGHKESERKAKTENGGKFSSTAAEKLDEALKEPQVLNNQLQTLESKKYLRFEDYYDSSKNGKPDVQQSWTSEDGDLYHNDSASLDTCHSRGLSGGLFSTERKDESSHKRISCEEQVHTFQQRKLKCSRGREQELSATLNECSFDNVACEIERLQAKRFEVRMASLFADRGSLESEAELRDLQTPRNTTGVNWNMKGKKSRFSERTGEVEKDADSFLVQLELEHIKEHENHGEESGNYIKGFKADLPKRPEHASKGPLACSFISLKGGVSSFGGKMFAFGGDTFTRIEDSSSREKEDSSCPKVGPLATIRKSSVGEGKTEGRVEEICQEELGLALGCVAKNSEILPGQPTTALNAEYSPVGTEFLGWNGEFDDSFLKLSGYETSKTLKDSPEMSCDIRINSSSSEIETRPGMRDEVTIYNEAENCWPQTPGALTDVEESRNGQLKSSKRCTKQGHQAIPALSSRLTSRLLDWYGKGENTFEIPYIEDDAQRSVAHRYEAISSPTRIGGVQGLDEGDVLVRCSAELKEHVENDKQPVEYAATNRETVEDHVLHLKQSFQPITAQLRRNTLGEDVLFSEESATKNKLETDQQPEPCTSREGREQQGSGRNKGTCAHEEQPLHQQDWSRRFRKKSVDKVSYFDKWLGRGRKEAALSKRCTKPAGKKCGLKRGDKPRLNAVLEVQAEHILDDLPSLFRNREQSVPPDGSNGEVHASNGAREFDIPVPFSKCDFNRSQVRNGNLNLVHDAGNGEHDILNTHDESLLLLDKEVGSRDKFDTGAPSFFTRMKVRRNLTNSDDHVEGTNAPRESLTGTKVPTEDVGETHKSSSNDNRILRGTERLESRRFSSAVSSHVSPDNDDTPLTQGVYNITLALQNHEDKIFSFKEFDCLDVSLRPFRYGHLNLERSIEEDLLRATQSLVGTEQCRFLFEGAVSNPEEPQDVFDINSPGVMKSSPVKASPEKTVEVLLPSPETSKEAAPKEEVAAQAASLADHSPWRKIDCRGGLINLEKDISGLKLDYSATDVAINSAANQHFKATDEPSVNESSKSSVNRKNKMPVVVRVKNGLANGWLLQRFMWKRGEKLRPKALESQLPTYLDNGQKETGRRCSLIPGNTSIRSTPSSCSKEKSSFLGETTDQLKIPSENFSLEIQEVHEAAEAIRLSPREDTGNGMVIRTKAGSEGPSTEICQQREVNGTSANTKSPLDEKDIPNSGFAISSTPFAVPNEASAPIRAQDSEVAYYSVLENDSNIYSNNFKAQVEDFDVRNTQESLSIRISRTHALFENGMVSATPHEESIADEGKNEFQAFYECDEFSYHHRTSSSSGENSPTGESKCKQSPKQALLKPPAGIDNAVCSGSELKDAPRGREYSSRLLVAPDKLHEMGPGDFTSPSHKLHQVLGRPKPICAMNWTKSELVSKDKVPSLKLPVTEMSEDIQSDDLVTKAATDLSDSDAAEVSPPGTGPGTMKKYKRLSRFLPPAGSPKYSASVPIDDISFSNRKDLLPATFNSENLSSSSLQKNTDIAILRNCILSPVKMRTISSSLIQEDRNFANTNSNESIPPLVDKEQGAHGALGERVDTCVPCEAEAGSWPSRLAEQTQTHVTEMIEPDDHARLISRISLTDDDCRSGLAQNEIAPSKSQRMCWPPWHDEESSGNTMTVEKAASESGQATWGMEGGSNAWEVEGGGTAQIKAPPCRTRSHERNQIDLETSGDDALPPKLRPDETSIGAITRSCHEECSSLPHIDEVFWSGPVDERGNGTESMPGRQGTWRSDLLDYNGADACGTEKYTPPIGQLAASDQPFLEVKHWDNSTRLNTVPTTGKRLNHLEPNSFDAVQLRWAWNCHSRGGPHPYRNKDEPPQRVSTEIQSQDQVFLERFSGSKETCDDVMQSKKTPCSDVISSCPGSFRGPIHSILPHRNQNTFSSLQYDPVQRSDSSFSKTAEPAANGTWTSLYPASSIEPAVPQSNQTVYPSSCHAEGFKLPLPYDVERRILRSNLMPNQAHHSFETTAMPDLRNSFSSVSASSSLSGYSENKSEKNPPKPKVYFPCSTSYDSEVAWGQYSEEVSEFKANATQPCNSSPQVHNVPSSFHSPNGILNSQLLHSACHSAQSTPRLCDTSNPLTSNPARPNQLPIRELILPQPRHHYIESLLSHPTSAACPAQIKTAFPQQMNVPLSNDCGRHYALRTAGPYTPPQNSQAYQLSGSWSSAYSQEPLQQDLLQMRDRKTASITCVDSSVLERDPARRKEKESGLVWLSEGEMSLIRELRLSAGKNTSRSKGCSEYTEPSPSYYDNTRAVNEGTFYGRESNVSNASSSTRCSNYSGCDSPLQQHEGGTATQRKAASIIQRTWRAVMRRRKEKFPFTKILPRNITVFYEMIKTRHSSKSYSAPPFETFVKAVQRIQAGTEGARVRRRLRSRRLQTIIMEIKEIRMLLYDMSKEANRDPSAPYLYPQLCNQLQQEIMQLHIALTGPQLQARNLLRRGPTTPLVLYQSKSTASVGSRVVPAHKRSPSKQIKGRSSPINVTSNLQQPGIIKKDQEELVFDASSAQTVKNVVLPYQEVPLKTNVVESNTKEIYEDQPLTVIQRRKVNMPFDEIPIGTANAGFFNVDYGLTLDLPNKPKRPFLKRKSIIMAPQKLDWSKVKPMVSSRLEPELKTKLSYCRHTKAVDRTACTTTSRQKKENYSQVKSRLFSYVDNNPNSGSSKGNIHRCRYNEPDEPALASLPSSFEGTSESEGNSRLENYPRPASPDFLRLKSQVQADTESEIAFRRAQASMIEAQNETSYSSRFDSARFLHKLGNTEQSVKGSMVSVQPRTQRIRLRLVPGSEESEAAKVLVQRVDTQEEVRDLWHDQRIAMKNRRRQSHSHRYASYRESSLADAYPSAKVDETRRPSSPPDRRALKAFASNKMGLATKELEDMFQRVIAAKCGRNITLSDLFEPTQR